MIVENQLTDAERGLVLRLVMLAATIALFGTPAEAADTKERDMLLSVASKLSGNPTVVVARHEISDHRRIEP